MAWELAPATIRRGESVRWWLYWPEYPGIQVFQARPVTTSTGISINSELRISDVSFEWQPVINPGYYYHFTVTLVGGFSPATYRIRGTKVD